MTPSPEPPITGPTPGRLRRLARGVRRVLWNRWARRVYLVLLVVLTVGPVWLSYHRDAVRRAGEERLAEVRHDLNNHDRNWTWRDLATARVRPAPTPNAADVINELAGSLPGTVLLTTELDLKWLEDPATPGNVPQVPHPFVSLGEDDTRQDAALAVVRRLRNTPTGYRPLRQDRETRDQDDPGQKWLLYAYKLLSTDALRSIAEGDHETAATDLRALLHASRVPSDEPLRWSQYARRTGWAYFQLTLQRCLGRAQLPDRLLADLHNGLLADAAEPLLRDAYRAERAKFDETMTRVADGRTDPLDLGTNSGTAARLLCWWEMPKHAEVHAAGLEYTTRYLRLAEGPPHVLWAQRTTIPEPGVREPYYRFVYLAYPNGPRLAEVYLKDRARLECAALALACERARLRTGRWPASLADIPTDILPATPTDPFDGQPYRYHPTPDGVVIYSVGPNTRDDGGFTETYWTHPDDVAFRLWNPDRRGVPRDRPTPEDKP